MAQIVALSTDQKPPEGVKFVMVDIGASGLQVITNAEEGTTFSAPDTREAFEQAMDRACAMADQLKLIVYLRQSAVTRIDATKQFFLNVRGGAPVVSSNKNRAIVVT